MIIERWRNRQADGSSSAAEIVPLTPKDAQDLNLGWRNRFTTSMLRTHLRERPGLAFRVAGTGDYIVGDLWRRRSEIGVIVETRSRGHFPSLVDRLMEAYADMGFTLVFASYEEQADSPRMYSSIGFKPVEKIIYYERTDMRPAPEDARLEFEPLGWDQLDDLIGVDHRAFPWLWWNSMEELRAYAASPDVSIYLSRRNGAAIGYLGFTTYRGWAHLDRLAVDPQYQGQGFGLAHVTFGVNRMAEMGAKRVTLSTQVNNTRSQALYSSHGFHRTGEEYSLHGKWLKEPPS